jgi:hypothetical protein
MSKAKKAAAAKAEFGVERSHDLPWTDKKVKIFKTLKRLGEATAATVAEKSGLTARDVRHYAYHAKAAGLVKIESHEGEENKYYFSLTAAGNKIDPDAALKDQLANRKSAKANGKPAKAKKASTKKSKKATTKATEVPAAAATTTTVA